MNGPDHYREAQDLAARTDDMIDSADHDAADCIAVGIAGLLHAVLAHTAATLDASADYPPAQHEAWKDATR